MLAKCNVERRVTVHTLGDWGRDCFCMRELGNSDPDRLKGEMRIFLEFSSNECQFRMFS
jgi:hypothetical protein